MNSKGHIYAAYVYHVLLDEYFSCDSSYPTVVMDGIRQKDVFTRQCDSSMSRSVCCLIVSTDAISDRWPELFDPATTSDVVHGSEV